MMKVYNDIYCKYGCCMSFDGYHGEEDNKTEMELMGMQDADVVGMKD